MDVLVLWRLRLIWNFVVPRVNYLIVWFSRIRKGLDSPNPRYYRQVPYKAVPYWRRPFPGLVISGPHRGLLISRVPSDNCFVDREPKMLTIYRNFRNTLSEILRYQSNRKTGDIRLNRVVTYFTLLSKGRIESNTIRIRPKHTCVRLARDLFARNCQKYNISFLSPENNL